MHFQEICSHRAIPLSELKPWWMTATQGSLSTGDYASSARRVTPIKGHFSKSQDRILPENT